MGQTLKSGEREGASEKEFVLNMNFDSSREASFSRQQQKAIQRVIKTIDLVFASITHRFRFEVFWLSLDAWSLECCACARETFRIEVCIAIWSEHDNEMEAFCLWLKWAKGKKGSNFLFEYYFLTTAFESASLLVTFLLYLEDNSNEILSSSM